MKQKEKWIDGELVMPPHRTKRLELPSGDIVDVDKGIIDLIEFLNWIHPHIYTTHSCQGYRNHSYNYRSAYLVLNGNKEFIYDFLKHLHTEMVQLESVRSLNSKGKPYKAFSLVVEIESNCQNDGVILRWNPRDFNDVCCVCYLAIENLKRLKAYAFPNEQPELK